MVPAAITQILTSRKLCRQDMHTSTFGDALLIPLEAIPSFENSSTAVIVSGDCFLLLIE